MVYKELPERNIFERIIKLRHTHNLTREDLATLLNLHCDTIEGWEIDNIMPKPESIIKLCEFYKVPPKYFHEYYNIYYNNPGEKIKIWKEKKGLTYRYACELLDISHSGFGRLLNGKINLSYYMYLKLKKFGVF